MAAVRDIRDHHARCGAHLARLQMLACREADDPPRPALPDEVAQATSAILAEARAAGLATVAAAGYGRRRSSVSGFLDARLDRLTAAAAEVVTAAAAGDAAALRRRLRRFEVLTSAMWTVQLTVSARGAAGQVPARPQPRRALSPAGARPVREGLTPR
jgi:hypothetical protein